MAERFAQAVAACRKRHQMGAALAETRARLEALVVEAEGLASGTDGAAAAARWPALHQEARGLTAVLSQASRPADDLAGRLEAVGRVLDERASARQAAAEAEADKARQACLATMQRLIDRARRAAEADSITLREGERLMRDIGTGLEAAGRAPSGKEIDEAVAGLRAVQQAVAPRIRELREMDDWRRFANAQRQEQLIAMAEAIVASLKTDVETGKESDLAATARALRELHTKWQEVAEAPRNVAQRLWDRFRTATDFIRARCESYFVKQREEREAALQRKTALVAEAETLAASTDWAAAAARLQQLQQEWQALGPVAREAGRDLATRFRAACNAFFARRREDLTSRRQVWADNLAKKEALCARAEELAGSTDWDAAAAELKRLQAEWKTIGPVRRNKSEAIWNRFRAAADQFFERFHHRHEITLSTKLAEREALVVELETLAAADPAEAPADLASRVQQLRTTWIRSVPIPVPEMRALTQRWQTALGQLVALKPEAFAGTDLDPALVVQRMEKLVARVESLLSTEAADAPKGLSPTEMLAAKLRSALASNAMGGRASDEAKWRAAADAVKEAQAAWQRLAPSSGPEAQALESRFREACRRVNEHVRRDAPPAAGRGPQSNSGPRREGRRERDRGDRRAPFEPHRETAAV